MFTITAVAANSFARALASSLAQNTVVTLDELDFVIIDTGTLSSMYLMMAMRSSAYVLNDLHQNTPASPKSVSGMIDFSARVFLRPRQPF